MATNLEALTASYVSLFRKVPGATDATYLADLAASIRPGVLGPSLATATATLVTNTVGSAEVGVLAYGFFTATTLRATGLDFLLSPTGPNPQNLNSAYYASFNTENRYINFAKNLGVAGEGAPAFAAGYGGMTLQAAATKAYAAIFGASVPAPPDLLTSLVPDGRGGTYTRADYFASYGGDGLNGIGTKAALVGWLLGEAAKAKVGPYATAAIAYLQDLAGDGQAQFGADFLGTYGPGADYAAGGRLDPGLPGVELTVAHDQSILLFASSGVSPLYPVTPAFASGGNDVILAPAGLDAATSRSFAVVNEMNLGFGNDTLTVSGGFMSATLDAGGGNDRLNFSAYNGKVTLGAGYDVVTIGAFSSVSTNDLRYPIVDVPEITDFVRGQDRLIFTAAVGAGRISPTDVRGAASFDAALATIAASTASGVNTVFEYGGSTYVFHQNADPAVNLGASAASDDLIRLTGLAGATVGAPGGSADIVFGG